MAQKGRRQKKHKAHRMGKRLLQALDLPEETTGGEPKCTLLGRGDLLIENHGGVLECSPASVRLYTPEGVLAIAGESLMLMELGRERAYVKGRIQGVSFEK